MTQHPVVVIRQPDRTDIHLAIFAPIDIGRECDGLLLADQQVSREHLRLETRDGRVVVTDLGSTNGTMCDGHRLDAPAVLMPGSELLLGQTTIRLVSELPVVRQTMQVPASGTDSRATAVSGMAAVKPVVDLDPAVRTTSIERVAESLQLDPVDVSNIATDHGTVTIVFSDIESSTERNVALGDQVWFEVLARHNEVVRRQLKLYNGTEIKNQGDGYMLSFPGARLALQCVIGMQQELAEWRAAEPERAVAVRVGMHTGEVLVDDDGDLFGQHVVVAARVANLATGGEILLSSLTKEIVASRGDVVFGEPRVVELKGMGGNPYTVYPVDWSRQLS